MSADMRLCFEPAQPGDAEAIIGFQKELIRTYEDPAAIDCAAVMAWVERKTGRYIRDYTRVRLDGEIVAYYHFYETNGEMELDDFYVLPAYRGRGIGTEILQRCCAQTALPIFLYVFRKNTRAIALYERMGFAAAERIGETRCIMRRN